MESDDEEDVVWIPIKENGERDMDWWVGEMLKKGDKVCHKTFEEKGEIKHLFLPWIEVIDGKCRITDVPPWKRKKEDKSNEMEKKEAAEIEKPKNIHQMNSEDKSNQREKKSTTVTKKPKHAVSLNKSIGEIWKRFKKNILFSKSEMTDKSEDAKKVKTLANRISPNESFDSVTFFKSAEVRQLIESIVQVAVDKRIKEMKEKIHEHSTMIKQLEKDLEKQHELVKKLEESLKYQSNVPKEPMELEVKKVPKEPMDLEETELKKLRRSLVVIGVPETHSDSDHEKNLADIESIGRILKKLEIETTPLSVYRMGEQKEDGQPRMLKVVMPSAQVKRRVLRQALKSKVYDGWGPIKMTTSLSTE